MKSTDNRKGKGLRRKSFCYENLPQYGMFESLLNSIPIEAIIADALTETTPEDIEYAKAVPDEYFKSVH